MSEKTPGTLPSPVADAASVKQLRAAVIDLSERGKRDVTAVRQSFISGIPPLKTAGSGSKSDFINRFAGSGFSAEITKSTSQFGLSTAPVVAPVPPPRPELDFVQVGTDPTFGVLDGFFTRVVFSISNEDLRRVSYFRVLRATVGRVDVPKPSFSALMGSSLFGVKTKSTEGTSNSARQIDTVGVGNKLTDFVADDRFSRQRSIISSSSLRPLPEPINSNRRGTANGLITISGGDRSVLENVTFYANRRMLTPAQSVFQPLAVSQRQGINVLRGTTVGSPSVVIESGNAPNFYEVARVPAVAARTVGLFSEMEYFDPAVVHGVSYIYYVVAVARSVTAGSRTRLVSVDIVRSIPPSTPRVLFGMAAGSPRFSVKCSGSFIDHIEVFRRGGTQPKSVVILNSPKAMVDEGAPVSLDSGFYHVGDVGLGADRSNVFVDHIVTPGQKLDYRFYAVDSFGMKSSTPFSCSVHVPNVGHFIPLSLPSITAEQVPGGKTVNIIMSSDDPSVTGFALRRRDLTLRENGYRQPTQPDYFTFGLTTPKTARSRLGPTLNQNSNGAWLGVFQDSSGTVAFVDRTVEFDHVYQYSTDGIDRRGNRTSAVAAQPIYVTVKPVSDAPTALTGTVIVDGFGTPTAVLLSWSLGTQDFTPNDLIGDQDVLAATSKRSVFQVERREVGKSAWQAMPAVTATNFIDPIGSVAVPKFRPSFALPNGEYDYRVIAMRSGAFLSTHTAPVRIIASPEISPPTMVWVRSTLTSIRPIQVIVSWQYDAIFVDSWEVERAVTNKLFGSKVFSMDSQEARSLSYTGVARVTRESSRGHGLSTPRVNLDQRVFVGNRFFTDRDISMANSYFYRVRAIDAAGRISDWSYGGISLTDSPFDRKFLSTLSDSEKSTMPTDPRPLPGWELE